MSLHITYTATSENSKIRFSIVVSIGRVRQITIFKFQHQNFPGGAKNFQMNQCKPNAQHGPSVCRSCCNSDNCWGTDVRIGFSLLSTYFWHILNFKTFLKFPFVSLRLSKIKKNWMNYRCFLTLKVAPFKIYKGLENLW